MTTAPWKWTVAGRLGLVAGLTVLVLVGSACEQNAASTKEDVRPAMDPAPVRGGIFRMTLEAPASLDPLESQSVYEALPVNQIFDGLVEIDSSLRVAPSLADTWTITDDGTTYRFHLRDGVRFHDGSELTASDVVYTLRRLLSPGYASISLAGAYAMAVEGATEFTAGRTDELSGVRAVDPRTVEIRLEYPSIYFLEVLTMDGLRIVPEKVVAEVGEEAFRRCPVGTGPFRFGRWSENSLELVANQDYFAGRPYLDGIRIEFPGAEGRIDQGAGRFLKGELDLVEPGTREIPELQSSTKTVVRSFQELGLSFLGMGVENPPLDRLEVRKAIAHAVNRDRLVKASPDLRRSSVGLIPPGMNAYSPESKALQYDPEEARRLLAQAGFGPDNPLPAITLLNTGASQAAQNTLESIRSDLAEVGIQLDVRQVTWTELGEAIMAQQAPMFLLAWIADLPDPDIFLRGLFESGGSSNYFAFKDDEVGWLLERGVRERNPMERSKIYRDLERRILSQAPVVPLYHTLGVISHRRAVHGLELSPLGISKMPLEKVWLADRGAGL